MYQVLKAECIRYLKLNVSGIESLMYQVLKA